MHFDKYGLIVSDLSGMPSAAGDSAAETGRWLHLKILLDEPRDISVINNFRTIGGYVRHPSPLLPYDWRESDFSSDQWLPLFLAARAAPFYQFWIEMVTRLREAGWRTGNGNLCSPILYALVNENQWLINMCVAAQALLFKLPWRWSDSAKRFESTQNSTGDYLNWLHAAIHADPWARKLVNPTKLVTKIESYYATEIGTGELLDLYRRLIKKVYGL